MLDKGLQAIHEQAALVEPPVSGVEGAAVEVVGHLVVVDRGEERGGLPQFAPARAVAARGIDLVVLGAELVERLGLILRHEG